MKKENIIYAIGAAIILVASIMKISHIQGSETIWLIALISIGFVTLYIAYQNIKLKKRLEE